MARGLRQGGKPSSTGEGSSDPTSPNRQLFTECLILLPAQRQDTGDAPIRIRDEYSYSKPTSLNRTTKKHQTKQRKHKTPMHPCKCSNANLHATQQCRKESKPKKAKALIYNRTAAPPNPHVPITFRSSRFITFRVHHQSCTHSRCD